ncbi:MAG: type ISP restriction/modification enzyme [Bacteroidota bacterium]|jgi:predicted helicase|nr:N-6 DNA methylase [Cytophagales bacterium]
MLQEYIKKIADTTAQGDAREESYYPSLSLLVETFAESIGRKKIQITTLPKKTEAGNPDFRIWDGQQSIVGYIEAKRPGENLDVIENSEQLKRYRGVFPNLILTDFYEFRLYRNGQLIDKVSIGRPFIAKKLKTVPPVENEEKFLALLNKYFSFTLPKVFTAESLASELAKRTRFLRDEVVTIELEEEQKGKGPLYGFYTAFKKYLIADLKEDGFADIYSQTITYGLFAARTRANGKFNRKLAFELIPQTIGILRDVFQFISLGKKLPVGMEVAIDDIAEVLQAADVSSILHEYYRKGKGEDPIVHFYETFLNIYDPATREKRGVYYTPEPVVKYIVRAIHDLLKTHFDLQDGLASKEVTLLDPAGGTLTFPAEAIKLAVKEFTDKYGDGGLNQFFQNHILKHYFAFELMMAPYAIGHIKIAFLLEELGYKMKDEDRFNLFLTNTLDMEDLAQTEIPGLESLSDESHKAGKVKRHDPILVILGNPPYSGISSNINEWTEELLKTNLDGAQSYYEIDGKKLEEKKLWLQDDYVKFLRFSQWKIQKAGHGIVGMITNHSYLDNPTFRGMRQSLMNTFNEIYIIDLHGNGLKKETTPEGGKDENVFDIRQGTAIALFIKKKDAKGCKVMQRDIFGLRETKYDWLEKREFKKKDYETLKPESPWYFFIERNTKHIEYYNKWMKVNEIFPVNTVGMVTGRDSLTIGFDPTELWNRLCQFSRMDSELARQTFELGKDSRDWQVKNSQNDIKASGAQKELITTVSYRPFDYRFTYYTGNSRGLYSSPQKAIMQHLLKDNLCLVQNKQIRSETICHSFLVDSIVDYHLLETANANPYCFPLYLYPPTEDKKKKGGIQSMMLFEPEESYGKDGRKPNISKDVLEKLEKAYKKKFEASPLSRGRGAGGEAFTPEQLLHYVYAVLYSNTYREKYAEFLKIDFPRIPFTSDYKLFLQLAELGEQLTELHLLKSKSLNKPVAKYKGKGDDRVEKPRYDEERQAVFINEKNCFEGVSTEVWNYHIGGYQVMEKYLKDRKGRLMEDPAHYCKIATALQETILVQQKIDLLFNEVEKSIIS